MKLAKRTGCRHDVIKNSQENCFPPHTQSFTSSSVWAVEVICDGEDGDDGNCEVVRSMYLIFSEYLNEIRCRCLKLRQATEIQGKNELIRKKNQET